MAQIKRPDWQHSAEAVGKAAFEGLELAMKTGNKAEKIDPAMPLLEGQRVYIMATLVSTARQTMQWMAKLQREGINIETAEIIE